MGGEDIAVDREIMVLQQPVTVVIINHHKHHPGREVTHIDLDTQPPLLVKNDKKKRILIFPCCDTMIETLYYRQHMDIQPTNITMSLLLNNCFICSHTYYHQTTLHSTFLSISRDLIFLLSPPFNICKISDHTFRLTSLGSSNTSHYGNSNQLCMSLTCTRHCSLFFSFSCDMP